MKIIGYLRWTDFLEELATLQPRVVRVQAYENVPRSNPPVVRFLIEAAFAHEDEIHVARFPLGSEVEFCLRDDPDLQARIAERMRTAESILRAALAPHGVEVRRGVFAGTHRLKIATSPDGLWRWEENGDAVRLVPEA